MSEHKNINLILTAHNLTINNMLMYHALSVVNIFKKNGSALLPFYFPRCHCSDHDLTSFTRVNPVQTAIALCSGLANLGIKWSCD